MAIIPRTARRLAFIGLLITSGLYAQVGGQFPQTGINAAAPATEKNQLNLGLGFLASYDDNAFNTVEQNGQGLFSFTPRVAWDVTRSHWTSDLYYSALVTQSNRFDYYDRTSHSVGTTFTYQFSKSLFLTLGDTFIRSADPLYSAATQPVTGAAGNPNPSYLGTPALLTSNYSTVNGDYRLDAHTDLNVGGSFYFQRYTDVPDASMRDNNSASGQASYRHAFSARTTAGVQYDLAKITTPFGFSTVSQRIMLTDEIALNPVMKLSIFAGPNHVSNHFVLVSPGMTGVSNNASWSWSAGGSYNWTGSKISMIGSAVRQISDGGGLIGTVRLTNFNYSVQGRLPYRLSASLHAGYSINDTLVVQTAGQSSAKFGLAGASLTRELRPDLTASVAYERAEQFIESGPIVPWIDRDRITVTINYTFSHPLGR